ncbi:MAG: MFS transporter [Rhodothermales bacterium]
MVRRIPKPVWILGVVSLLVDLSSEMLYPVVPIFLASVLAAPPALIGFIEGVAEVTAGFTKGYFGSLSDRLRRRKMFVVLGYTLSALMKPVPGVWISWGGVLAARTLDRVGKGIRTAPRDALLAAYSTPQMRGRVFGLHRGMDTLGAALGPAAALLWLAIYPGDYRTMFFLAFVPAALGTALTLLVRERAPVVLVASAMPSSTDPGRSPEARVGAGASGLRLFWRGANPEYRRLVGWLALFALANSSDVFLILKVREAGLGDQAAIGGYILYNLTYAAAAYPAGGLSDRIGRKPVMVLGLFVYAGVYVGFALGDSTWQYALLFACYGIYAALTEGVAKAWIADLVPNDAERGRGLGLFAAVTSLASLVASTVAGLLWTGIDVAAPFVLAAAAALVTGIGLSRWSNSAPSRR